MPTIRSTLTFIFLMLGGASFVATRSHGALETTTDPFRLSGDARATVVVFVSTECPLSNRYAGELRRLHQTFSREGVAFLLAYPNPSDTPEAIRVHMKAFGYPMAAVRDPDHALVRRAKAKVTPEAAIFDVRRQVVYHGRIDNRLESLGVQRPEATRHDLENALAALIAGKPIPQPTGPAVGCFVADFVQ